MTTSVSSSSFEESDASSLFKLGSKICLPGAPEHFTVRREPRSNDHRFMAVRYSDGAEVELSVTGRWRRWYDTICPAVEGQSPHRFMPPKGNNRFPEKCTCGLYRWADGSFSYSEHGMDVQPAPRDSGPDGTFAQAEHDRISVPGPAFDFVKGDVIYLASTTVEEPLPINVHRKLTVTAVGTHKFLASGHAPRGRLLPESVFGIGTVKEREWRRVPPDPLTIEIPAEELELIRAVLWNQMVTCQNSIRDTLAATIAKIDAVLHGKEDK